MYTCIAEQIDEPVWGEKEWESNISLWRRNWSAIEWWLKRSRSCASVEECDEYHCGFPRCPWNDTLMEKLSTRLATARRKFTNFCILGSYFEVYDREWTIIAVTVAVLISVDENFQEMLSSVSSLQIRVNHQKTGESMLNLIQQTWRYRP